MSIKSRKQILEYFQQKDPELYRYLREKEDDVIFPFQLIYRLSRESLEILNLRSLCTAIVEFNKYKDRRYIDYRIPELTSDVTSYLTTKIESNAMYNLTMSFINSVQIATNIIDNIVKDYEFRWFMKIPYAEYIFVDLSNVYFTIKSYNGSYKNLKVFRSQVIRDKPITQCLGRMIRYLTNDLNCFGYKFIMLSPIHVEEKYDNDYFCIHMNYESYLSNEIDDVALLMLYDYCRKEYGVKISVLSSKEYEIASIMSERNQALARSMFSAEDESYVMSNEDIEYNNI